MEQAKWLNDFTLHFQDLSNEEKNSTLDHIIDKLDAAQLYHLSTQLEKLITRDFIVQLPEDITRHLLQFIDIESLLKCCQVNKNWDQVVSTCSFIWKDACHKIGINPLSLQLCKGEKVYKNIFLDHQRMLRKLQGGDMFYHDELYGHMDRVMAVYYNDGFLATGSDDHTVRIWDCSTSECVNVLRTHSVADLKLFGRQVFTASFDTTAACWDIDTGQTVAQYIGHVGAVFSIDFNIFANVVVTGSADSTVKLWQLDGGQLLRTLTQHRSAWITHVYFFSANGQEQNNSKVEPNDRVLDKNGERVRNSTSSVCKDNCSNSECDEGSSNYNLNEDARKHLMDGGMKGSCEHCLVKQSGGNIDYFIISQDNISLHCWHVKALGKQHNVLSSEEWHNDTDMALLPGLWRNHKSGSNTVSSKTPTNISNQYQESAIADDCFCIGFVKDSTAYVYSCGFDVENKLKLVNLRKKRICSLPVGVFPQTYLGSGDQFDAFLVEYEGMGLCRGPGLHIIHAGNADIHGSVSIPIDYRPSKRGSSYTLCNTNWLDNVLAFKDCGEPLFAVAMKDNRVYLIKCNKFKEPAEQK